MHNATKYRLALLPTHDQPEERNASMKALPLHHTCGPMPGLLLVAANRPSVAHDRSSSVAFGLYLYARLAAGPL